MKKMLNVLYITDPQAYLAKDGETIIVRIDDKIVFRTPVHYLEGIVTFGYVGASPALLGMCAENNIAVTFLSANGRYLASVHGPTKGNVLLRRKQYRWADCEEESARLACCFVIGKIANCRTVLRRFVSDYGDEIHSAEIIKVNKMLARNITRLGQKPALDEVRGIEGESARNYFSTFDDLIVAQKEHFCFDMRSRRPPLDNTNALLSFLYALLLHETKSALETVGLDPYVGFLHRDRPGREGLALDLMEEFRPYLADRLALSLINRRQVSQADFILKESGGVFIKENARKVVLDAWQKRKKEEITHPFMNEKIQAGLLPYTQALLLARHIRGDLETYPPFVWR